MASSPPKARVLDGAQGDGRYAVWSAKRTRQPDRYRHDGWQAEAVDPAHAQIEDSIFHFEAIQAHISQNDIYANISLFTHTSFHFEAIQPTLEHSTLLLLMHS